MTRLNRYVVIVLAGVLTIYVLIKGKIILVPLGFAVILFLILMPLHQRWLALLKNRFVGVICTLLTILIPIVSVIVFFSLQIAEVVQNLSSIGDDLQTGLAQVVKWVSENKLLRNFDFATWVQDNLSTILEQPLSLLKFGISESTQTLSSFILTFIYLLFFLLYQNGIKKGILLIIENSTTDWRQILGEIRRMIEKYLRGMIIVMGILAILNSLGLWLIGVDYPVFWGVLASLLALIPYLGTLLGGGLPLLYSIAVSETWWQPLLIFLLFASVQFIEGNFITPKIVGDQVSLNPLTAIVALIIGASIWGLSGVVLAIPMAAVVRIVSRHFENLRPLAYIMGPEMSH